MNRTREKDVIHICKGWYDKSKYNTVIDALIAYQAQECKTESKYISHKDILDFSLYPTAEKHFTIADWRCLIQQKMEFDIRMMNAKIFEHIDLGYEYICSLIMQGIENLRVKDKNANWIINMDGYRDIKHII